MLQRYIPFFTIYFLLMGPAETQASPADTYVHGRIFDAGTGEAIGYSHLYVPESGSGTAAGPDGRFRLPSTLLKPENARIRVSAVGYATTYIPASEVEISEPLEIGLTRLKVEREEAVVTGTRLRTGSVNNRTFWWRMGFNRGARGHFNPRPFDHVSYGLAQPISTGRAEMVRLRYIELRVSSVSSRTRGDDKELKRAPADSLLLRFRLTGIGEDGMPDDRDLLPKQILKTIPAKKQRLHLDLTDYSIEVPSTFYLITELLIEDPETDHGYYPLFESIKTETNNYFRFNPADNWRPPSDPYFTEMVYEVGFEY